jgi:hypothetical protein
MALSIEGMHLSGQAPSPPILVLLYHCIGRRLVNGTIPDTWNILDAAINPISMMCISTSKIATGWMDG